MNSRQRVLSALNHNIPDRVPIDFGGFLSGIHWKAYLKLIDYLGIKDELIILDPAQQLAEPCEQLLQRLRADIRYINLNQSFKPNTQNSFKDEFGIAWTFQDEQHNYMYISNPPLANSSIAEIKNYSFQDSTTQNLFTDLRKQALIKSQNSSFALSTPIGGSLLETCSNLRGIENWFIDTMESPLLCEILLDKVLKYWMDFYTDLLKEIGDIVDIVIIGDDLAGQNGPLFSLDFYRTTIKPRQQELMKHIKSLTNAKICYHTCGSCFDFIPDLIDIGIDILNPVQIGLKKMDPQKIKDEFGKHISLWGGAINAHQLLSFSNREKIRRDAKYNINIFKSNTGYIFSSTHNIQFDVPPENIVTLFDAAFEYGSYL
ncbi:MAG: hypothetical protein JXA96_03945 [Sedimentisphaerales bacterium]|nr:hypothetical protein [Sedimentisphaerales bacterium]